MSPQNLLKNVGLAVVLTGLLALPFSSFALFSYGSTSDNVLSLVDERSDPVSKDSNKENKPQAQLELPNYFVVTEYPSK